MNARAEGFFGAVRLGGVSALAGFMMMATVAYAQDARQHRSAEPATEAAQASQPDDKDKADKDKADKKDGELPIPAETKVETKHDWTAGARPVHYTATAGTLLIKDDEDKPIGSMFYVAYTEDGVAAQSRPVTFLYNGGPGRRACGCIWDRWGRCGW